MNYDDSQQDPSSVLAARAVATLAKRQLCRRSLLEFTREFTPAYQPGWVHQEVADTLAEFMRAVERKESPRLIITMPPRIGKTQLASRCFPAWVLGHHPEWEIISTSYGQELANEFGGYVRDLIHDPRYGHIFPGIQIKKDTDAKAKMGTSAFGGYLGVGIGGPTTGRGAHVLIVDDPVKNREEADSATVREAHKQWYQSVAYTRLAPGGGVILIMTRWHEDDLAGYLINKAKNDPEADQFMVIKYEAIATKDEKHRKKGEALHPERWPLKEMLRRRANMDSREWSALYQQNPVPDDGIFFTRQSFKFYDLPGPNKDDLRWYIIADLAIGERSHNDYTFIGAIGVDHMGRVYAAPDFVMDRMNSFTIVEKTLDIATRYNAMEILAEHGHIQKSLMPIFNKRMQERGRFFTIHAPVPHRDKQARAQPLRARMDQGMWFWPNTKDFMERVYPMFLAFPAGMHDDPIDAYAHGAQRLDLLVSGALPPPPLPPIPTGADTWATLDERAKPKDKVASVYSTTGVRIY